jgi:RHH-type proline utilization regulon transcriptional repressor/proline dehydrogenase/delta 1-pyrroline-5-carboxylate dehydrogenase
MSQELEEALELIDRVKGSHRSMPERKRLSVELAALLQRAALQGMTQEEKKAQEQLSRLMQDPVGKAFTTAMTDECFRSHSHLRTADQMNHLLSQFRVPSYLDWFQKLELLVFKSLPSTLAQLLIPFVTYKLRKETSRVILPEEPAALEKHILERKGQGVRLNLNHLGEAILSEAEAEARVKMYLTDLENPNIDYVSIKVSTIYSQINLLAWQESVATIAERLKGLYRAAMKNSVTRADGSKEAKFINLDMEEYKDLHLTVAVFIKALEDPEFHHYSAGIVLQAYLPDVYPIQKELTDWAKQRIRNGGAWIKIRIVKGANLAMEQFEASLRSWAQAPYTSKGETDANYKKMVMYGCIPENARAVRLGIASHNLFDIAFAMLLRAENQVEPYVHFEMLEGMANHICRVVQKIVGTVLLYCPVAKKEEFQHAIAYLVRRLDENTGPENFLRYAFGLRPGTESWEHQTSLFFHACDEIDAVPTKARRTQNRLVHPPMEELHSPFENEPDTDFALLANRKWADAVVSAWRHRKIAPLPLVISGKEIYDNEKGIGLSPNDPHTPLMRYAKADKHHIAQALDAAEKYAKVWGITSAEHRCSILARAAHKLRERRGDLIGAMIVNGGKTFLEADPEVSEAVDFAEYYYRQMDKMARIKDLHWTPKGIVFVVSPWNFPCAIPTGCITGALAAGNCVIFKPSSEAVLVAWELVNALWDAGVPKEALQFVPCSGEEGGAQIMHDPRVSCAVLTGSTETAKKILKLRPDLDLIAETGGKNSLIISALSDRDLAIKDLLQSAFGHAGQKCSAASLAILEAEVYDDRHFLKTLRNAALSLKVGPSWDFTTKINPLIHPPTGPLLRALTTLEPGEEWLLEPKQDSHNPHLWSPGIKLGVRSGSFTHMTELFGPVLGLMRADDLHHAITLANVVPYGLTAGFHGLDAREQAYWTQHIEAGNLYINRPITGAIVRRQPFGGIKASSFGNGSKAGGPNYLREFMTAAQVGIPQEKCPVNEAVNHLTGCLENVDWSAEKLGTWTASIANYAYWWRRLKQQRDPTKIVGQDNFFRYVPRKKLLIRLERHASSLDALRAIAAVLTVGAEYMISRAPGAPSYEELPMLQEEEQELIDRLRESKIERIRLVGKASRALKEAAAEATVHLVDAPVLANGRYELLHYLREVSISFDYHRYGNLGLRDGELRSPIL